MQYTKYIHTYMYTVYCVILEMTKILDFVLCDILIIGPYRTEV